MSSSFTRVSLDLTPTGLFPGIETADGDPKCLIISEVIQRLAKNSDTTGFTQLRFQEHAAKRYTDLSQESRLSLPDADRRAYLLFQKGVSAATAQRYYSYKLSEADATKWTVRVV